MTSILVALQEPDVDPSSGIDHLPISQELLLTDSLKNADREIRSDGVRERDA